MEDFRVSIKDCPTSFPVGKMEWHFFVTGIGALRRMVGGTVNEHLLTDVLAGKERVMEFFSEGCIAKLGQRIEMESWHNQAKRFRQDLFDNLDYVPTHHFSDVQTLLTEADQLRRLLEIVHEDAPIVLGFLKDLRLTAGDVEGLRQGLPFKHALTAVLKVMGSSNPAGYNTVVKETIERGSFDKLLSLIIWIARDRFRLAPQEVYAVLGIIVRMGNFSEWTRDQWDEFKRHVEGYYKSGLPMLTYDLFKCFLEHQKEPSSIEKLKIDMENQLGEAIAWGGLRDMSGPIEDELAVMARFMPVRDRTLKDYSDMALRLKRVLVDRHEDWIQEVDEGLRQLYMVSFTRTPIVYEATENKAVNRESLNQRLSLLAREDGERPPIQEVFDCILRNQELRVIDQAVLVDMIFPSAGVQRDDYIAMPREDRSNLEWLNRWTVLLGDSWHKVVKKREVVLKASTVVELLSVEDFNRICRNHSVPTIQEIEREPKASDKRQDWVHRYPGCSSAQICRKLLSIRLLQKLKTVFLSVLADIQKEQINYKTREQGGLLSLFIGFFDDFLHLMGCMGTGVCNWDLTDQLVADCRYHFGAIALKDEKGCLFARAQVQLLRESISDLPEKRSSKGWQVLAVTTNNFLKKDFGVDTFVAYTAMLEVTQILAEKNGLQGAVLVEDPEIHAQEDLERGYVQTLAERGWLVKRELSEDIIFTLNYRRVYLIQIPTGTFHLQAVM